MRVPTIAQRKPRQRLSAVGLLAACLLATGDVLLAQSADDATNPLRFEVSFPRDTHPAAITGRVFVILSQTPNREPRLQVGRTGVPFFGRDVEGLTPGVSVAIDATDLGSPVETLRDLPPGTYFVQAMLNVYSEFRRADGHVVWMHDDRWEGQDWRVSPGNLYSDVQRVHLDPLAGGAVSLSVRHVVPDIDMPADTAWVKRFKFQSPTLTEFWGRPIYLGATVLLPDGYDGSSIRYPVLYHQDHFSLAPPHWFRGGE